MAASKKETQYDLIYNFVKQKGSITPKQAFPLGITKLATRISEMTRSGKYSVNYVEHRAGWGFTSFLFSVGYEIHP